MAEPFEPEILAICCNHCSYAAADLAGSMRLEYPDNVKIVRLPCTGVFYYEASLCTPGFMAWGRPRLTEYCSRTRLVPAERKCRTRNTHG